MALKKRSRRTHTADAESNNKHNSQIGAIRDVSKQLNDAITYKYLNRVIFIAFLSMVVYVINFRSNVRLLHTYYIEGDYWYFRFLLAFIVLSGGITVYESYGFYNQNGNKYTPRDLLPDESLWDWTMKWCFGIALACSIPRNWDIIQYAWKAKQAKKTNDDENKIYFVAMIWEDAELTKLNQFLCFMKSAAQLLLNLYIMIKDKSNFGASSMILSISSIINLSSAMVSYDRKISLMKGIKPDEEDRQNNESSGIDVNDIAIHYMINTNWTDSSLLFFSHFFWIISRLIALSLFAIGYGWIIWPVCIVHLIVTFIWHLNQNYGIMDAMRLSFLHLFAYLPPLAKEFDKRRHPRLSPAIYQPVSIVVNLSLMLMWTFHVSFGMSSDLSYPWNESTFFDLIWIVQLATILSSCFLFWWLNKKRQV